PAITSNGHNHTAPGHSHNTLIGQGGDHSHTSAVGGLHTHDAPDTGDHTHRADAVADHNHSLTPGWTQVEDGGRPGNVTVSVTADSVTTDVPGEFGDHDTDWEETIDMGAYIGTGVSRISFSTSTHGMLEYVLVVEIDQPYGVISGQDVIGPGGELQVPVWVPANTISASAYLFGSDYHMAGTSVDVGGNHTHDALAEGNHVHTVQENLAHSHVVGEGDHEHEGYASNSTPGTTSSTPTWSLPAHRHDLSWVGMTLSNIDFYSYGRQLSNN
ncbi:MAG: hypothetical protein GWN89_12315, partial [Thermoplasmata archaeon]|nr:hypothetical protein [Thermoplasmata archaeon]